VQENYRTEIKRCLDNNLLMFEVISRRYLDAVDKFMEGVGYVPEGRCEEVFGGIPKFGHCGLVGASMSPIFAPKRSYIDLGQYRTAYRMIVDAVHNGHDGITFTADDLPGACLFSFNELKEVQERARQSDRRFMARDLEMYFDWKSLFPEQQTA